MIERDIEHLKTKMICGKLTSLTSFMAPDLNIFPMEGKPMIKFCLAITVFQNNIPGTQIIQILK